MHRVASCMACWLALVSFTRAQSQEARVGPLGAAERLMIRGARGVPPQKVVEALFADPDVAYASFPDAPLPEFKRLLVEKTVLGLRHHGFPSPRVTAVDRLDHLELDVAEGPRWTAGEIRVRGSTVINVGELLEGLSPDESLKGSAKNDSRWPKGKPARLDEPTRLLLAKRVDQLLAQQGYPRAKADVQIVGDHARGTATLLIVIHEEGTPVHIGDIELVGNKIHTREQILAYLQLPADAVLSTEVCREIEARLDASGRFGGCKFSPAAKGSTPRLTVDEFAKAPRLDQTLSAEESTLLTLSAWVGAFDRRNEDLAVNLKSGSGEAWLEMVLSPRRGLVARIESRPTQIGFDLAIEYSVDRIAVYSGKDALKLAVNLTGTRLVPYATFTLVNGAARWDGEQAFNFWIGSHSRMPARSKRTPHAQVGPGLTASAALSVVRKHQARCEWEGPILTARWSGTVLRVDSRDGRLVELQRAHSKARLFARKADREKVTFVVAPAVGLFDERRNEIARATAGFANVLDPQRLMSGTTEFLCRQLADNELLSNKNGRRMAGTVGRLSQRGALRAFDDLLVAMMRRQAEPFRIPAIKPPENDAFSIRFKRGRLEFVVRRLAIHIADELFLRGSHPWLVWREVAFITNGKTEHTHERLARLFPEEQCGPLTTLALAEAMRLAGMTDEAANWVRPRLEHATLDGFRREYAELIRPGWRTSTYLLDTAAALRGLDPIEAERVFNYFVTLGWLSMRQWRQALAFLKDLRTDPNRPVEAALAAALDGLWERALERQINERLQAISSAAINTAAIKTAAPPPNRVEPQARRRGFFFR